MYLQLIIRSDLQEESNKRGTREEIWINTICDRGPKDQTRDFFTPPPADMLRRRRLPTCVILSTAVRQTSGEERNRGSKDNAKDGIGGNF